MLTNRDREIIITCARKYAVDSVLLFGSTLADGESHDLDLAVRGGKREDFFKLHGELFRLLSKPVDLVDLSVRSRFTDLIESEGRRIFPA